MVEKMEGCEYHKVDKTSAPCHNPAVFIDRLAKVVVCVAHADSLGTFLSQAKTAVEENVAAVIAEVALGPAEKEPHQGFKINTDKVPGSITPGL